MTLTYFETADFCGRWRPCTAPDAPAVTQVNGHNRIKSSQGIGPRVRAVQPVPNGLERLDLASLHAVLSPDGYLRGTHK